MMSKAQKLLSGRAISVLLAFSTCLVLLASACGESDSGASGASAVATQAVDGSGYGAGTSPPMSVESPAVSSMSRSDADILDQVQDPLFYGAASPSLDVELGTTLDALLPANMTCAILNGDSNTETPDNCHKGDQAYATGRSPVAASRIFRPAVKNLLNQADGLSIQHFDEHSSNQFRIVGARPPDSHDTVHKVGRTTGWTSGTIKVFADPDRTCPGNPLGTGDNDRDRDPNDPGDDFFIECLVWTLYQSEGGDSGSPVFVEKTGSVGAVREVLLVGVHYAGAADEGLFIPIERIYAESLLQDYDWLLDEIRPLPALNDDFDEGLEMDEAGRTIVATFDMKDFGHGPGLAYEAVLYRKVGTVTSQVTDTFGSVYKQEVSREVTDDTPGPVARFDGANIPVAQQNGEFSVRVRLCAFEADETVADGHCSDYGSDGGTTLHLPPAPQNLRVTATSTNSVTLAWNTVSNTTGYEFEYRATGTDSWIDATNSVVSSPASLSPLSCNTTYEFVVRAYGDGTPYDAEWGFWSAPVTGRTDACPA